MRRVLPQVSSQFSVCQMHREKKLVHIKALCVLSVCVCVCVNAGFYIIINGAGVHHSDCHFLWRVGSVNHFC